MMKKKRKQGYLILKIVKQVLNVILCVLVLVEVSSLWLVSKQQFKNTCYIYQAITLMQENLLKL